MSIFSKVKAASKDDAATLPELDESTLRKAESRFYNFWQLYDDPDPAAQGPAPFN